MSGPVSLSQRFRNTGAAMIKYANNALTLDEDSIRRLAVNHSGVLGSFYDVRTDQILKTLPLGKTPTTKIIPVEVVRCTVMNSDTFDCQKLFHDIGIHDELWLNVILNIVPGEGMLSLVNYSFPSNQNIRFFYYYYSGQHESIKFAPKVVRQYIPREIPKINATHIISGIKSGIQVFAVLELSSNNETSLDILFQEICKRLTTDKFELKTAEKISLSRIKIIEIFSNTPELTQIHQLPVLLDSITIKMPHAYRYHPLEYSLRDIKWFYPNHSAEEDKFILLEPSFHRSVKQYLLQLSTQKPELVIPIEQEARNAMEEYSQAQLNIVQNKIKKALTTYPQETTRICDLIIKVRKGILSYEQATITLTKKFNILLPNEINIPTKHSQASPNNENFISDFQQKNNKDSNITNEQPTSINEKITPPKPLVLPNKNIPTDHSQVPANNKNSVNNFQQKNTEDSNPSSEQPKSTKKTHTSWQPPVSSNENMSANDSQASTNNKKRTNDLQQKNTKNSNIPNKQSNNIDETVTPMKSPISVNEIHISVLSEKLAHDQKPNSLSNMPSISISELVQSSKNQSNDNERLLGSPSLKNSSSSNNQFPLNEYFNGEQMQDHLPELQTQSTSDLTPSTKQQVDTLPSLPTTNYINVLLLGESGVGKSTFINAFVNYLQFETFEAARSSDPVILMPVSFLLTVGHSFEEQIVKFGDADSNEDYDHPGQSVTQHCKSYVFKIDTHTYFRIIDTPGMGDTRGLDQDDYNMQHILSFINNLSHLNAICILLKPNESKLNIVLRSYFTHLLNFLSENARHNIIFCFTNTRSTFFAPGDTAPLIKKMINNLPTKDIPFNKSNVFCFDNEAFRYLIALQNKIEFDTYEEEEYQTSWKVSVTESNRLFQYISETLDPYDHSQWQSIEHLQIKISQRIFPILETMRNMLRNIILKKEKHSKTQIKLNLVIIPQSSDISYETKRTSKQHSNIWSLPDDLYLVYDEYDEYDCILKKHIDDNYILKYEITYEEDEQSDIEMKSNYNQLKEVVFEFAHFYVYVSNTSKLKDPFLNALKQIIDEESQICSAKGSQCLNSQIRNILIELRKKYEEKQNAFKLKCPNIDLQKIYKLIETISTIDDMKKQLDIIEQGQENYLKQHEKEISYRFE
ncbi:unnamed protein product [Rotaria sp. Silwood1]|nr:unnamed protein product [Rotaria sp. Silwood1]CAF4902782.1 unnamed protein product [Rotaria sp. Silwood1]